MEAGTCRGKIAIIVAGLAAAGRFAAAPARAQEASAEEGPGFTLHGFVLTDYAVRATGTSAAGVSDFLLGEERGRLDLTLDTRAIDAGARFTLDAVHDAVSGRPGLELRAAYLDYRTGALDLRLGRQLLSWGVGDLTFVNDVFPKDLGAFFVGRPIDYLEVPSDAARASLAIGPAALDLVAIPIFSADGAPPPDRFIYGFDPFPAVVTRRSATPTPSLGHTELAARLHSSLLETDLALYAFWGFFHTPSPVPDDASAPTAITLVFPARAVLGASLQRNLMGGVVSAEAGLDDSRDNPGGRDPFLPRTSGKWLARYERELPGELTLGLQYAGQLFRDRYLQTLTLRATLYLHHQTLRLSLLGVVGVTERDVLIVPELEHALADRLSVVVGATVFGGVRRTTPFGMFRDDSNVHLWARFRF